MALRGGGNRARPALVLFTGTLLWSLPALALTAPTLLSAVPGLPNDHYHTYLDPLVLVVAATGIAAAAGYVGRFVDPRASGGRRESRLVGRGLGLAALVVLVAVSVWRWPPAAAEDGGWPLADEAAGGSSRARTSRALTLVSLPEVKSPDAIRFPLERRGAVPLAPVAGQDPPGGVILVCDPLFEDLMGARCGGEAELAYATHAGHWQGAAGPVHGRRATDDHGAPGAVTAAAPLKARTPAPADRRSLSPRPRRGGTPGPCPGSVPRDDPASGSAAGPRAAPRRSAEAEPGSGRRKAS